MYVDASVVASVLVVVGVCAIVVFGGRFIAKRMREDAASQ